MGRAFDSRTIWIAIAAATASFGACVDFGALSGGDAGAPSDASASDALAASDVATNADGNTIIDGGSTSDADAGMVFAPFVSCATFLPKPALCDDFDEGSITGTAFSSMTGALSLDTTSSTSGSDSLLAQYGSGADAYVQRDFIDASFPTSQHLSLQFFPGGPSLSAPSTGYVASWYASDGTSDNGGCEVGLKWTTAKMTLEAVHYPGIVFSTFDLTVLPTAGQWSRIDILLTDDGSKVSLTAYVNGAVAGSTGTDCGAIKGIPRQLDVGLTSGDAGAFRFDNVEFDGK